jgi:hypothetical protein
MKPFFFIFGASFYVPEHGAVSICKFLIASAKDVSKAFLSKNEINSSRFPSP